MGRSDFVAQKILQPTSEKQEGEKVEVRREK